MRKRPLISIAVAYMLGVVADWAIKPDSLLILGAMMILLIGLAAAWLKRDRRADLGPSRQRFLLWGLILVVLLGALRYQWEWEEVYRKTRSACYFSKRPEAEIEGTVDDLPSDRNDRWVFPLRKVIVADGSRTYSLDIRVNVITRFAPPSSMVFGDRVRIKGRLKEILSNSLPEMFDYREYAASQGIYAQIYLNDPDNLSIVSSTPKLFDRFRKACWGIQRFTVEAIEAHIPSPHSDILLAMLIGRRTNLSSEIEDAFRRSGIYHLVSVSGLHFAVLLSLLVFVLKVLGSSRKTAALICIPAGFALLTIVGFQLPAIRSLIMSIVIIGALFFERDADTLNDLGLAALLILFVRPLHLFNAGFQMSFLTVAGIALVFQRVRPMLDGKSWARNRVFTLFLASFAAGLFIAPVIVAQFRMVTPVSILANMAAVPLAAVAMWTGIFTIILSPISTFLADISGSITLGVVDLLRVTALVSSKIPGGAFTNVNVPLIWLAAFYLLILQALISRDTWERITGGGRIRRYQAVLCVIGITSVVSLWLGGNKDLQAYFLNVGQGDSIWIELPGGGNILVDGGGMPDSKPLQRFLKQKGITGIDMVVLTHPEADHVGELPDILKEYPVDLLVDSGIRGDTEQFEELERVVREKSIPRMSVKRGNAVSGSSGVRIAVLSPEEDSPDSYSSVNERSIVLFLEYNDVGILLGGDIGAETERELRDQYSDLDCTVLKVPHHGSRTSTGADFLDLVDPEIAVIEVGKNTYGHPDGQTLERLNDHGSIVFRTDRDGTIRFSTDGKSYSVIAERRPTSYVGEAGSF